MAYIDGMKSLIQHLPEMRRMYECELLSCDHIAKAYGCTRQRVWQLLRAAGVETTDHKRLARCHVCGEEVLRHRYQVRKSRKQYCGPGCYAKHVSSGDYQEHRHSSRVARAIAEKLYDMRPEYEVHHLDGNQRNNTLSNMVVFHSAHDHHTYHRSSRPVQAFSLSRREMVTLINNRY